MKARDLKQYQSGGDKNKDDQSPTPAKTPTKQRSTDKTRGTHYSEQ